MEPSPVPFTWAASAAGWLRSRWQAFRSLPTQTQLVSVLASGVLIVSVVLAVALWPSAPGSKAAATGGTYPGEQVVFVTPGQSPTMGPGAGGSAAGGGASGGSGGNQSLATPTAGADQQGTPSIAITCLAVAATAAQLCVHTAAGASLSATVTYTAASLGDASPGLAGARVADASGNYTWTWTPIGAVPGANAQACVVAQLGGMSGNACQPFVVSAQPLPSVVPTVPAVPTVPLPSITPTLPLPTVGVPPLPTPTLAVPTAPIALPSVTVAVPTITVGLPSLSTSEAPLSYLEDDGGNG